MAGDNEKQSTVDTTNTNVDEKETIPKVNETQKSVFTEEEMAILNKMREEKKLRDDIYAKLADLKFETMTVGNKRNLTNIENTNANTEEKVKEKIKFLTPLINTTNTNTEEDPKIARIREQIRSKLWWAWFLADILPTIKKDSWTVPIIVRIAWFSFFSLFNKKEDNKTTTSAEQKVSESTTPNTKQSSTTGQEETNKEDTSTEQKVSEPITNPTTEKSSTTGQEKTSSTEQNSDWEEVMEEGIDTINTYKMLWQEIIFYMWSNLLYEEGNLLKKDNPSKLFEGNENIKYKDVKNIDNEKLKNILSSENLKTFLTSLITDENLKNLRKNDKIKNKLEENGIKEGMELDDFNFKQLAILTSLIIMNTIAITNTMLDDKFNYIYSKIYNIKISEEDIKKIKNDFKDTTENFEKEVINKDFLKKLLQINEFNTDAKSMDFSKEIIIKKINETNKWSMVTYKEKEYIDNILKLRDYLNNNTFLYDKLGIKENITLSDVIELYILLWWKIEWKDNNLKQALIRTWIHELIQDSSKKWEYEKQLIEENWKDAKDSNPLMFLFINKISENFIVDLKKNFMHAAWFAKDSIKENPILSATIRLFAMIAINNPAARMFALAWWIPIAVRGARYRKTSQEIQGRLELFQKEIKEITWNDLSEIKENAKEQGKNLK